MVLDPGLTAVALLLGICAVLVFVPVGYVYPSRTNLLRGVTLGLTTLWLVSYAVLLDQVDDPSPWWLAVSLGYVVYYVALSLYLTFRRAKEPVPA